MKKTPLKKKSNNELSKAKGKAWDEFSIYIRTRDADKD